MKSVKTNHEARCPACLSGLSGATNPTGNASPRPGDLSVCAYCGQPCVFQTDLTLRALRSAEFEALPDDLRAQIDHSKRVLAAFRREREAGLARNRRLVFSVWTLFDHPLDDPQGYVLRRFDMVDGRAVSTGYCFRSTDIEWLRQVAREMGMVCLGRNTHDEPQVVESWL